MNNDPMKTMLLIKKELEISPGGISMSPFLKEGRDKVIIKESQDLKLYDIALYKVHNEYILHRIIGFEGNTLVISGDNARLIEKKEKEEIIGVVTEIIRRKRKINPHSLLCELYCFLWYKTGIKKIKIFARRVKRKLGRIFAER